MDDDKRDEVYELCVVGDQSDIVTQDQVMDSATSKPYFNHSPPCFATIWSAVSTQ